MKISVLLPYKENFSPEYAGAVSLFIKETLLKSKYKDQTIIYGNTNYKKRFDLNYRNINIEDKVLYSKSKAYINEFIKYHKKTKVKLIEVHNRPMYVKQISTRVKSKIALYFHNDPLTMGGSVTVNERENLVNICYKIIFNSHWSYNQFVKNLDLNSINKKKLIIIHQSASKNNIHLSKKKKSITFVGKLNKAKGYDIFGGAIIKILNKYKDWSANVIGDESRENHIYSHSRLKLWGFLEHKKVINIYKESSISVACSRWEEPFGRTSLEASANGCAVIITNRGGLSETITDGITIDNLTVNNLYKQIKRLIDNSLYRKTLQKNSLKNFYLSHSYASNKIDKYRDELLKIIIIKPIYNKINTNNLKILHVTNFNTRHDGRLFYNTGRRINNGFIKLGHTVLEFSDRDIINAVRSMTDLNGSKTLNRKFLETVKNFKPNLIVIGHADLIYNASLEIIKKNYPDIKIAQWFLDRMDSEWKINRKRFEKKFNYVDANFCTTSPDIMNFKKKFDIYYIPNPVDRAYEKLKIFKNKEFKNDVFFAMSHGVHRGVLKKGKHDIRQDFINKLIIKTPEINYSLHGVNNLQPVWADKYLQNINLSKMGLNLSQGKAVKYYSSDRISQMIGNGLLTFVDSKTQLSDFFTNKEVIFYNNITDLSEKIIYYKKNDYKRALIAKNGWLKYFKYFDSTHICNFIISKTLNIKKNKFYWE
ncbi:glycosyltransferase [Candidatus Pelagibacter sp.]|nr:glycosyltransferase [Candidatus Pelagibacter sp.]